MVVQSFLIARTAEKGIRIDLADTCLNTAFRVLQSAFSLRAEDYTLVLHCFPSPFSFFIFCL